MRYYTNAEKKELMQNKKNWPRCQECGNKIKPDKYNRARKADGKAYMEWRAWQNAKFCSNECGHKSIGKKLRKKISDTPAKYCSVCDKPFFRTEDISPTRWQSIKNCPEHRGQHKRNVFPSMVMAHKDCEGEPIAKGFYVFDLSKQALRKRVNPPMNALEVTLVEERDYKIDRICEELSR